MNTFKKKKPSCFNKSQNNRITDSFIENKENINFSINQNCFNENINSQNSSFLEFCEDANFHSNIHKGMKN